MTTGSKGLVVWMAKGALLLGLSAALVVGADRLVGSLRRDVHAVLARPDDGRTPAAAPVRSPAEPILRVARAGRR